MMLGMERTTPLASYLVTSGRSVADFASAVGAHRSQIDRIAKGQRGAGGVLALAIERETSGAVKAAQVVRARKSKRRHSRRVARPAA